VTAVQLTKRQQDILLLIADGMPDREISDELEVSMTTVYRNSEKLRLALGARNQAHAVARAYQAGLLRSGHG
jgi:DNA-binding NarL/FixJ family response regulator